MGAKPSARIGAKPTPALVDPAVSLTKFEHEVAQYRQNQDTYIKRGWWLVKAEFPQVFMVFGTPAFTPAMAPFGALIDFTNYDIWPPSVQLVHPFTQKPYTAKEIPIAPMPRRVKSTDNESPPQVERLLQANGEDDIPFICVPGIREYHQNPAHSGDSWFIHRNRGEGTLYFLVDLLGTYGLGAVKGYEIQRVQIEIGIQGPENAEQVPE